MRHDYRFKPEDLEQDQSWRKRRNCHGIDPDLFFNEGRLNTNPSLHEDNMEAIKVCLGCEVKRECLIECASSEDTWTNGIWAGTTPGTRKRRIGRYDVVFRLYDFSQLEEPMSYKKELTQKAS